MEVLDRLYAYHQPLAASASEGVLAAPLTPILGLNAAYGNHPEAPLCLSGPPIKDRQLVQTLQVGTVSEVSPSGRHLVEQVNWLQTRNFARVLCQSWNLPEWEKPVSQHLSMKLQEHPEYIPLLCYQAGHLTGCALLKEHQVHLWGVMQPDALPDLLHFALAFTGSEIETTLTAGHAVPLENRTLLGYWLKA